MRRILPVLLLLGSLLVIPGQAQTAATCSPAGPDEVVIFCDDFQSSNGWTTGGSALEPGGDWKTSEYGNGDDAAWFVGFVDHGGEGTGVLSGNYADDSSLWLMSPEIDLTELHANSVSYDIEGATEAGYDYLVAQVRFNGGSWATLASYDYVSAYSSHSHTIDNPDSDHGTMQLRFQLSSDGNLNDGSGWYVDNVGVNGIEIDPVVIPEASEGNPGNVAPLFQDVTITDGPVSIPDGDIDISVIVDDDARTIVARVLMWNEHGDTIDQGLTLRKAEAVPGGEVENNRDDRRTFEGQISGNDIRLTTGTWQVAVAAYDEDGGIATMTEAETNDIVVTTTAEAPVVTLVGGDPSEDQIISAQGFIRFEVGSDILRGAKYGSVSDDGSARPQFVLKSPYVITPVSLFEGRQEVTVTVTDRDHRTASITVPVIFDDTPPKLVNGAKFAESLSATFFANVSSAVEIETADALPHNATFIMTGCAFEAGCVSRWSVDDEDKHIVPMLYDAPGTYGWSLQLLDDVGNRALHTGFITVEQQQVDLAIVSFGLEDEFPILGDIIAFEMDVQQKAGQAPIDAIVRLIAPGLVQNTDVTLDIDEASSLRAVHTLRPGQYEAEVFIGASGVNETNFTDNNKTLQFEVYLGKVIHGEDTYYVRVDDRGLPVSAVSPDGKTYPVTLNQTVDIRFEFDVDGNTLYWQPQSEGGVTTIDVKEAEQPADDDKGIPFPAIPLLLAALFLAARRK